MPAALPAETIPANRVFDGGLDIRMGRVADVTERCRQIGGADEHAIDTLRLRNGQQVADALQGLDLTQHAGLRVGFVHIPRMRPQREARAPPMPRIPPLPSFCG